MIETRARTVAIALGALLAVAVTVSVVLPAFREPAESAPKFRLTDHNGRPFDLSGERGHPFVLFFGYTHCTDVCPVTVAHLAAALRSERLTKQIRVLFITVDPERDTPKVLHHYVGLFDPSPIGLTGSRAQLDPVFAAYHVWTQKQASKGRSAEYSVAHGTALYFIDASGRLRGLADWNESAVGLVRDFKEYLS